MKYKITHTTKYSYSDAVPVCQNKLHLAPRNSPWQRCTDYRLLISPEPRQIDVHRDYFDNRVDYFTLIDSHRGLAVTSMSLVENTAPSDPPAPETDAWEKVAEQLVARPPRAEVDDCLFAYDSEFAPRTPAFLDFTKESLTPGRPIFEAVADLTACINDKFQYNPQATTVSTPVAEVFEKRAGVCQDFAHFQIACLRSAGLAARYVSGYLRSLPPPGGQRLVGADASHAWVSVYCGNAGWIDFDPTNDVVPTTDHITIAYGRDYGDVCPIQGVFVGGGDHSMSVSVDVEPLAA